MRNKYKFTFPLIIAFLLSAILLKAQERVVSGTVIDESEGQPIPGVNIIEKGTYNGSLTDINGNFSIEVNEGAVLMFSFVGFLTKEVEVGNQTNIQVSLVPDIQQLQEVVVIGYGQQKKEDLTGAVTAIDNKDFNKGVITSPQQLLVGKVAGVQVVSNSGAPGSENTIKIRGGSSITASNDPLIVIDGFPIDNSEDISGMPNPLTTLNPNDIESFTVLKDASATAIYGSRASNGVIIITTKKGSEGGLTFDYNGLFSMSTPTNLVEVFNAEEYKAIINDLNERGMVGLNDAAVEKLGNADTDWQDEIYRDAFSQNHNFSMGGAIRGTVPFRASYGYTDEQGILKTTYMKRHTLDLSFNPSFFDNHLKVNVNAKGMYSKHNFGEQDAIGAAIAYDPTQPVRNGNTRFGGFYTWVQDPEDVNSDPLTIGVSNPVALLYQTNDKSDVYRTLSNIQLDYKFHFLPELRVNVNAGIDYVKSDGYDNAPVEAPWTFATDGGRLKDYEAENESRLFDIYFNYVKELGSIHRIDATAGYSWQHFKREGFNYERNVAETTVNDSSTYANEYFLVSFFGRLNYTLHDKYLFTATVRSDGSSRFGEDSRWGLFPALALAWRINEEPFLINSSTISQLKLRLGYGVTGQQNIGNDYYPYLPIYRQSTSTAQYQFGNTFYNTLRPDPYDANLKWEETTTYNIGLDFGFLNNQIYGSLELYRRETRDLLNEIPIPAGSNFSNFLTTNVGNLENQGVELTLNAKPVVTDKLTWDVGANFTYNENEITKLTKIDDPDYPGVAVGDLSGGVGNKIQVHKVGSPVNSFYVFEQVYDENGMPIEGLYVDKTGEGGAVISNDLNKNLYYSPTPEYQIGINSRVNYGNLDFSFSGRFNINNYVYNDVMSERAVYSAVYNQAGFFNNLPKAVTKTDFVYPQYWSDFYMENASFFKMDNISLGYSFNSLFTEKFNARVSFTVNNAFVITDYSGIDPEVENGIDGQIYPRPRMYVLGINLTY